MSRKVGHVSERMIQRSNQCLLLELSASLFLLVGGNLTVFNTAIDGPHGRWHAVSAVEFFFSEQTQ